MPPTLSVVHRRSSIGYSVRSRSGGGSITINRRKRPTTKGSVILLKEKEEMGNGLVRAVVWVTGQPVRASPICVGVRVGQISFCSSQTRTCTYTRTKAFWTGA